MDPRISPSAQSSSSSKGKGRSSTTKTTKGGVDKDTRLSRQRASQARNRNKSSNHYQALVRAMNLQDGSSAEGAAKHHDEVLAQCLSMMDQQVRNRERMVAEILQIDPSAILDIGDKPVYTRAHIANYELERANRSPPTDPEVTPPITWADIRSSDEPEDPDAFADLYD